MISICIPVYNFNVETLVNKLSEQSKNLEVLSEIVLIDDCSEVIFRNKNSKLSGKAKYIELDKNIGRAAIRNLFLKHSKFEYLLFLDCDSIVYTDDFLSNYIKAIKANSDDVICGGREYEKSPPERRKMLRWKYGMKKESKPVEVRQQNPNASFMTNNFVISRKLFKELQFDERLKKYGHEDTLFGFELKKRGVKIIHVDNPILNGHLENNSEYLKNTENAITNLNTILEYTSYNKELINDITLLKTYYKYYYLRQIIRILFLILKPLIRFLLSNGFVNLYLFDFYKLGILTSQKP